LFSEQQQQQQQQHLNHFYYTCLKRVLFGLQWSDSFFAFIFNEISLEDRCLNYWNKYFVALADTVDGELILELANLNNLRDSWLKKEYRIMGIYRSKRFVEHTTIIEKILSWCSNVAANDSIPNFNTEEVIALADFPDSF
jgi:hypothetical protein